MVVVVVVWLASLLLLLVKAMVWNRPKREQKKKQSWIHRVCTVPQL
jgi:uncharacterized protein YggT (Ycf19 family)